MSNVEPHRKESKKTWQTQAETYIFIEGVFVCFDFHSRKFLSRTLYESTHRLYLSSLLLPYLIPYLNPHISFPPFTYSIPIPSAISSLKKVHTFQLPWKMDRFFQSLLRKRTNDWLTWSCHLFEFLTTLQFNSSDTLSFSPEKRKKTVNAEISHLSLPIARRWTWLDCMSKRDVQRRNTNGMRSFTYIFGIGEPFNGNEKGKGPFLTNSKTARQPIISLRKTKDIQKKSMIRESKRQKNKDSTWFLSHY